MLIKRKFLDGIVAGTISLVFRRWKRPTVKTGGSLRTHLGVLAIDKVEVIEERDVKAADARRAGYASRAELLADLRPLPEGKLYRITLHYDGADPRLELRGDAELSDQDVEDLNKRLSRMDARGGHGPWTTTALELISKNPGARAADLADMIGMEKQAFKLNIRKLKELGLTQSLEVGYRLSPRGAALLARSGA